MPRHLALAAAALLAACASSSTPGAKRPPMARPIVAGRGPVRGPQYPHDLRGVRPLTRAERTNFRETSRYADVRAFLDTLQRVGTPIFVGSIGRTSEGREIPYVIASRPLVTTARDARRLNRPIVYVQANIHGGEVEGKEAILSLMRDLIVQRGPTVLDSLVLIAVPIYNADGNERFAPQVVNRPEQNGPELVGARANADSLDLNRDYIKAEAPETRASLAMFQKWDPDVFVDLHTTDGSYHGYALTYAPSLSPAALITGAYTRDTLLPELRRRMQLDYRTETFDYGNFVSQDSVEKGWFTYDSRPRFGTNYYGIRGRIGVLSEAYSHDTFDKRVAATYKFVWELLSYVAENAPDITGISAEADRRAIGWGTQAASAPDVPLRSTLAPPSRREAVRVEVVANMHDSVRYQPGMPLGLKPTGEIRTPVIPIYDRFAPTLSRRLPYAYAFRPGASALVSLLQQHGVFVERTTTPIVLGVERFVVDTVTHAPRLFQKHHETRLAGHWVAATDTLAAGDYVVRTGQPLAVLASYLLEPESEDGAVTWNLLDAFLRPGAPAPVVRVVQPVLAPLAAVTPR